MTRCAVTDLIVEQCAHCVAPSKPTPADPFGTLAGALGRWFRSMYDGTCSRCDDRFEAGDRIRADGEGGYEAYACCGDDA